MYRKREELKYQINLFARAFDMDKPYQTWTINTLAKALEMKPSTHLRNVVSEVAAAGKLRWEKVQHRPNVVKVMFTLSDDERARVELL